MEKPQNPLVRILIFAIILITMFLWISHTFKRTEKQEIRDDIKKEIWREIGLLEKACNSTNDINQIFTIGKPQISYLRFVGKPAAPMIIEVLVDKNKDWKLRFVLAQLLSKMETKKVIAPLKKILTDETEDENMRIAAAVALANLKFDEVIDPLLKMAKGNNKKLQLAAIYGLGELRKETVINEFKKWVVEENDPEIKKELELAIEKFPPVQLEN
ncbi:MAG: HEAT repeat domain-containing protein [bacterium]